ncbi:hypothetical protein [Dysosmobacter sp.]|uniref:hypothetical protein n=1 Tax=Dysosmobacter sp. TaxID=2591382 RepID=UPI002A8FDDEE|nr:hypothetical protein [Dysosmobacter sp.]MDY3282573.1 hypothetical protein [Dysosmobacter sp.]
MLNYLTTAFLLGGAWTFIVLLLLPVVFLAGVSGVYFLADTFWRIRSRRIL